MYVCIYVNLYTSICIYIYIHTHVLSEWFQHGSPSCDMYKHIYVYLYIYTWIYIHIHTHIPSEWFQCGSPSCGAASPNQSAPSSNRGLKILSFSTAEHRIHPTPNQNNTSIFLSVCNVSTVHGDNTDTQKFHTDEDKHRHRHRHRHRLDTDTDTLAHMHPCSRAHTTCTRDWFASSSNRVKLRSGLCTPPPSTCVDAAGGRWAGWEHSCAVLLSDELVEPLVPVIFLKCIFS